MPILSPLIFFFFGFYNSYKKFGKLIHDLTDAGNMIKKIKADLLFFFVKKGKIPPERTKGRKGRKGSSPTRPNDPQGKNRGLGGGIVLGNLKSQTADWE